MAIPAYLWLKDDGGAHIKGSVDVRDREGSIEILSFSHGLLVPTDNNTGKITGTRLHSPLTFEKEFDSSVHIFTKQLQQVRRLKVQSLNGTKSMTQDKRSNISICSSRM